MSTVRRPLKEKFNIIYNIRQNKEFIRIFCPILYRDYVKFMGLDYQRFDVKEIIGHVLMM